MASFFSSLCCCSFGQSKEEEVTERTALLNPDFLPEAPSQLAGSRSSEQQLAEQDALRAILNDASDRFVNVASPSPFSRPSPYSSRSASPTSFDADHQHETSWRPSHPDPPIKVIHLGTAFEPHSSRASTSGSTPKRSRSPFERPTSAHSLKTLPRGKEKEKERSPLSGVGGDEEEEEDEEPEVGTFKPGFHYGMKGSSMYGGTGGSSKDGTWKTAREENGDGETVLKVRKSKRIDHRGKVRDLWNEDTTGGKKSGEESSTGGSEETEEEEDEEGDSTTSRGDQLSKALVKLEESMKTFKLTPVGPLVENLSDAT